ncbi:hypothetical protein TD95_002954 [Thielaviopsis punctulata]|uniref:3-hydroxyisobutyrate dehydrogenase n=1 Tax=Thielaviopsis punctulata TaxID=72032 RepID=A0A0F4ZK50_9PEZI|nr:hypothetical protein TD95_002954 [Thielaviopsis punctulata]
MLRPLISRTIRPLHKRAFSQSSCRQANYAFIGLGQMGFPMARNLQRKLGLLDGLRVFDVNKSAVSRFLEGVHADGASTYAASSALSAAEDADYILTVLPEPEHVVSVYDSIFTPALHARPRTFIDCSTIDPQTSLALSARAHSFPQTVFLDAPMSGGVVGAGAGTLTFMLGASAAQAPQVAGVLGTMGARVVPCGGPATGLVAKLANNYVLALTNVAVAEAMNLGLRWGMDARVLADVMVASTGRCWAVEVNNPVAGVVEGAPAERDYMGGFGTRLMSKDLRLARVAAEEKGARLELAEKASEVYEKTLADEKCKGRDFSVVYRWLGGKEPGSE